MMQKYLMGEIMPQDKVLEETIANRVILPFAYRKTTPVQRVDTTAIKERDVQRD